PPARAPFTNPRERCAAAARLAPALATAKGEYVFHPYPVTPYHGDYLHHADLVVAAKARAARAGAAGSALRRRVPPGLAALPADPAWRSADGEWDATLEEVDLGGLVHEVTTRLNGWIGPPWLKEGWFQAHTLYARGVSDATSAGAIEETFTRRVHGGYASDVERLNLERRLVSLLTRGCERVVGARRRGSAAGARRQRLGAESRTCRGERRTRRGGGGRARARVGDGRAPAGGAGRRRGAADHLPRDVLEVPRRDQDECRRRRL